MYKKYLASVVLIASLLLANSGVAYAAGPGFLASLWGSFSGAVSIVIKSIYAPFNSPPPVVKPANPENTASGAIKSGATPGPLYIPGKFGFGGTGGVIPATLFPIPKNDKSADVSNIGNVQPKKSLFNTDTKVPAGKGVPYATPQPPTPYPKTANPEATVKNPGSQTGPALLPTTTAYPPSSGVAASVKAMALIITTPSDLSSPIPEGKSLQFSASLKFSNGALKNVSDLVSWSSIGDIGSVSKLGLFVAQLGPNTSEYGEGVGSVIASYGGPEGIFLGKSSFFKVYTPAPPPEANIGGQ